MFISLKDWSERDLTAKEVIQKLNMQLAMKIKGARAFTFGPPAIPGLGNGSGYSIMLQDKGGNTPDYLQQNAMKFIKAATEQPEIFNAFSPFQANVPQRYMKINIVKTRVHLI